MVDLHKGPAELTDQEWLLATAHYVFGSRGWQRKIAEAIGVSQPFISQVLNAQRALNAEQRAKLAKLCSDVLNDWASRRKQIELMEKYWRDTAEADFKPPNIKPRGKM